MSDRSRNREELLDDLVGLITAGLATRSDDELEQLLGMLKGGQFTGYETLPSAHDAVLVQVDPDATKDAVAEALKELSTWVEENWDAERVKLAGIELPDPEEGGYLN